MRDDQTGLRAWKFSKQTLDGLMPLYEEFKGRPVLAGTKEAAETPWSVRLRDLMDAHAPFLLNESLLLANYQWAGLFGIILAGMVLSRLLALLLIIIVRSWFKREDLALDPRLKKDFVRPIRIAFMSWVWLLGLTFLGLPAPVLFYLRVAAKTITAAGAAWAVYRLIDIFGEYLVVKAAKTHSKFDDLLVPLITRSLKIFVVAFGLVFVAETLELEYRSILAGLGLGGLAFALAARDTVSNVFGSLTVLLDRPFQIGDWVRIGDVDGNVETVGIRSTRIRTFYNSLITVPNSQLITATVDNMGARRYRRIKTLISITYQTPPEKIDAFCEGIREIIRLHPYTRKDYFHVYFNQFGVHALEVLLYCFVETPDWSTELRERHRLFVDIVRLADRLGVEFALPTQTLYMRKGGEPKDVPTPTAADDAFVLGRREAERIIHETLGKDAPVPPPVTFDQPSREERLPQGEDDD